MGFLLNLVGSFDINQSPLTFRISSVRSVQRLPRKSHRVLVVRSYTSGSDLAGEEVMQIFLQDRQLNGDFISKASDIFWSRKKLVSFESETSRMGETLQEVEEVAQDETSGGFLKLAQTKNWISSDDMAPINKKLLAKERQNDREKRKKLNLLKYDALKRELLLLTTGIGAACTGYCLLTLSIQAGVSYAAGVLFSCLYLQLLYYQADNLSKEAVPQIFLQKKVKKIGIRSDDLKNFFERTVKGSGFALSSPRLAIPAAIYGCWGFSHHFLDTFFDFQLVPAMLGLFAYKAAALVQVYRDNEDLRFIFSENEDSSD